MCDPNFVETKLSIRTEADGSSHEVRNNRYHYHLEFTSSGIGYDFLQNEVLKVVSKTGVELEPYKLEPSNDGFVAVVRETARREGIDDSQSALTEHS